MIRSLCQKWIYAGVDSGTPELLANRILYTNIFCLASIGINLVLGNINVFKGYYVLAYLNLFYLVSVLACLHLNRRRDYLASRVTIISAVFAGLLFSALYQGKIAETEHFFIPLAVASFCAFTTKERNYSLSFMLAAILIYFFLMNQDAPLIPGNTVTFSNSDRVINRVTYLFMFALGLYALSSAIDRAMKMISDQKTRLFEERKLALIGSLALNVAHEINSPLAALDLHLYQLELMLKREDVKHDEIERRLHKMVGMSKRISIIVRGLKFLSRPDDNDPVSVQSLRSLLESTLELNRERIMANRIRLEIQFDARDTLLSCRPVALSQVFLNLINNAADAVQGQALDKRWIGIKVRRLEETVEISFEDGGQIESESTRANLFKTFFTTKPAGKGTGLGLSISRETIEAHYGSLTFDHDSPNTRFVVILPIDRVPSQKQGSA